MGNRFHTVAVMGNPVDAAAVATASSVIEYLTGAGLAVLVSSKLPLAEATARQSAIADADLPVSADLLVAVGGDGTMLYAARIASLHGVPVLGINRGRLGFLADIRPDDIQASLSAVLAGDYTRETRMLLQAEVLRNDRAIGRGIALNDIVIKRRETARMLEYRTSVDGRFVNTHGGDGFIAATPTGSTAYALSCGGPIVEPGLEAIVLAPICPHTLTDRPIVISGGSRTEVTLLQNHGADADVSADGELIGAMAAGDVLRIVAAPARLQLIHPPGYDYFGVLRSKLFWGRDTRDRGKPPDT